MSHATQESKFAALEVVKEWTRRRGRKTWDPFLVELIAQAIEKRSLRQVSERDSTQGQVQQNGEAACGVHALQPEPEAESSQEAVQEKVRRGV
jgi:hypothetical protein